MLILPAMNHYTVANHPSESIKLSKLSAKIRYRLSQKRYDFHFIIHLSFTSLWVGIEFRKLGKMFEIFLQKWKKSLENTIKVCLQIDFSPNVLILILYKAGYLSTV